jgi:hypothetical protein
MKHKDLIKHLFEYQDIIDKTYIDKKPLGVVDKSLIDSTMFIKFGDGYRLNKAYIDFVNIILQRVDYNIIFGKYEQEYKEIIKLKNQYQTEQKRYIIDSILKHIDSLYFKFFNRDKEILALIIKLENETSLDIDTLIFHSYNIVDKIEELIEANQKIGELFRVSLKNIHSDIDKLLRETNIDMLEFINSIDIYINRLNIFIIQTQNKRIQNKKLLQLSNSIIEENSSKLDNYLLENRQYLHHSIYKSQKNKISTVISSKDIPKLKSSIKSILDSISSKTKPNPIKIKNQKQQKIEFTNIDLIVSDLKSKKSDDIFEFIYNHTELKDKPDRYNESFRCYIYILSLSNIQITEEFNKFNIKVVKWT